ncbi:MAG: protein phosphatase 2C domain-containing protein [Azospirillaceae bacterium]|nr:protein phosphatase 2C domain-containing protein [Azospirillaceae bacterium]
MDLWNGIVMFASKAIGRIRHSSEWRKSDVPLQFVAGYFSDVGPVREINEDSVLLKEIPGVGTSSGSGLLAIVADGMGGHAHGEIASRLACEMFAETVGGAVSADPKALLLQGIERANHLIFTEAGADAAKDGMGTTLTALLALGGWAAIAHVGDSRAYLVRDGVLQRLTDDHTLVGQMQRDGLLTAAEAREHPDRSIITRALGLSDRVDADVTEMPGGMFAGDRLCLCSDGLYDVIEEDEILSTIEALPPNEACRRLVERAVEAGTTDNVSVIVIGVAEIRNGPVPKTAPHPVIEEEAGT